MKIEERVIASIALGMSDQSSAALSMICPAVEATARKKYALDRVSASQYKNFLREYYDIMFHFLGGGIDIEETRFPDIELKSDSGRIIREPDVADIVYHAFRCSLAHGHDISENFSLNKRNAEGSVFWSFKEVDRSINMPETIIWSLIAIVIFCKDNSDIITRSESAITLGLTSAVDGQFNQYRFDVDLFWGGEGLVRHFLSSRKATKIQMQF